MKMLKLSDEYDRSLCELDLDSIPQCQISAMAAALLKDMREYFSQPGVEAEYREWRKKNLHRL